MQAALRQQSKAEVNLFTDVVAEPDGQLQKIVRFRAQCRLADVARGRPTEEACFLLSCVSWGGRSGGMVVQWEWGLGFATHSGVA